jgi:hypothetical protein
MTTPAEIVSDKNGQSFQRIDNDPLCDVARGVVSWRSGRDRAHGDG